MKLTLVNHACVKLEAGAVGVLCDPWIDGPAFNDGWDLLVPTPLPVAAIMAGVTHVWLSHEHPDHFSPSFLARVAASHRDTVTILFQRTRDGRVAKFCRGLGFRVVQLEGGGRVALGGGVTAICGRFDFYDSWLHLSDGRHAALNLNDCALRSRRDLAALAAKIGRPDLLMSQFSYAAWKGGKANRAYRDAAARQKLEALGAQARALQPRCALPFASLVYFSNVENSYLNDAMNTPRQAAAALAAAGTQPVVLFPGDAWEVGAAHDNEAALARYDRCYAARAALPLRPAGASASLDRLAAAFAQYRARIYARNSRALIALISKLPLLGAFRPLAIRLTDSGTLLALSLVDGLQPLAPGPLGHDRAKRNRGGFRFARQPWAKFSHRGHDSRIDKKPDAAFRYDRAPAPDVALHSASLLFLFENEFGYDTLTVNGRFEASAEGFAKMTRALALGSLNAMGLSLSPRLLADVRVVLILAKRLRGVLARLERRPAGENA